MSGRVINKPQWMQWCHSWPTSMSTQMLGRNVSYTVTGCTGVMSLDFSGHSTSHKHCYPTSVGTVSDSGMVTWPQWALCQAGWPQWAQCRAETCLCDLSGHNVRQDHRYMTSVGTLSGRDMFTWPQWALLDRVIITWPQWAQCRIYKVDDAVDLGSQCNDDVESGSQCNDGVESGSQCSDAVELGVTVSDRIIITWPQWA